MTVRFYLGIRSTTGTREIFRAPNTPTQEEYGYCYTAVIGPFRTKRGTLFMALHGYNNPHCRTVNEAERLATQPNA